MKPLPPRNTARVLIIAGSDSGGGAGIQGDLKTVTCLSGYAATAITALTAQNTLGVYGIHEIPEDFIAEQIKLVLSDIGADVIKTGMLHKSSIIDIVADTLTPYTHIPLILDPVMFAKGGAALLETNALETLRQSLIPMAYLITPNIPEAEYLSDTKIRSVDDAKKTAKALLTLGCKAVLLKGGHAEGDAITDILATADEIRHFTSSRLNTTHTHGTGCTLASAIATLLGRGVKLEEAVTFARHYVRNAIEAAPGLGHGHGPLGHNYMIVN